VKDEDYIYTNLKPISMSRQNLKPNGFEMEENWLSNGLGTSIPTAKSGNT
jgi:hypothetical protein